MKFIGRLATVLAFAGVIFVVFSLARACSVEGHEMSCRVRYEPGMDVVAEVQKKRDAGCVGGIPVDFKDGCENCR